MRKRTRKAHLGTHPIGGQLVTVTAVGDSLIFRVKHSRKTSRVSLADASTIASAELRKQVEHPGQLPLFTP